ncbi:hypothetical protein Tco_0235604, partial [Tanacetum coccineum]
KHKGIYVTPSHTKKVFANMKRPGKGFSRRVKLQKIWSRRKQRKSSGPTEPIPNEATNEEHIPAHFNDPLLSSEDRLQLNELMEICTNLQKKVLDLETSKAAQALKFQEDASKQRRNIGDLDADEDVTLIDETQGRNDEDLMFDTGVLNGDKVFE